MLCDVRFSRFEENGPNYIAEHHKPSYNHPKDGHGPKSTRKKGKPKAMYTQHAERGIKTTGEMAKDQIEQEDTKTSRVYAFQITLKILHDSHQTSWISSTRCELSCHSRCRHSASSLENIAVLSRSHAQHQCLALMVPRGMQFFQPIVS